MHGMSWTPDFRRALELHSPDIQIIQFAPERLVRSVEVIEVTQAAGKLRLEGAKIATVHISVGNMSPTDSVRSSRNPFQLPVSASVTLEAWGSHGVVMDIKLKNELSHELYHSGRITMTGGHKSIRDNSTKTAFEFDASLVLLATYETYADSTTDYEALSLVCLSKAVDQHLIPDTAVHDSQFTSGWQLMKDTFNEAKFRESNLPTDEQFKLTTKQLGLENMGRLVAPIAQAMNSQSINLWGRSMLEMDENQMVLVYDDSFLGRARGSRQGLVTGVQGKDATLSHYSGSSSSFESTSSRFAAGNAIVLSIPRRTWSSDVTRDEQMSDPKELFCSMMLLGLRRLPHKCRTKMKEATFFHFTLVLATDSDWNVPHHQSCSILSTLGTSCTMSVVDEGIYLATGLFSAHSWLSLLGVEFR
ncbi:hypothetical protein L7F22_052970 [Adiantum nelumboides]|nr:hypothetical protein [Adiantum nelumboides]